MVPVELARMHSFEVDGFSIAHTWKGGGEVADNLIVRARFVYSVG